MLATTPMTIRAILREYVAARELKHSSEMTLSFTVNLLCDHCCRDPKVAGLTSERINKWLAEMKSKDRTKIKHRGNIITLLRFAADRGYCANI